MNPTVSVIIPCYNHGHYLPCAVNSVLAQTFSDWEAIIVDDGSTDHTRQVAAQFTDPRIRYIYQENRGLSAARNAGIRAAQGEYLAFLDADDEWEPAFLDKMMYTIRGNPEVTAVYCGFRYIDRVGNLIGKGSNKVVPAHEFHRRLICEGNWLGGNGVLLKKSSVFDVGLFDESLRAGEDADLWIRLSATHMFIGVPETLVRYRRHGSNMSSDPDRMVTASYQMTEKMFGPPVAPFSAWSELKRCAYARVYRLGVASYFARQEWAKSAAYFGLLAQLHKEEVTNISLWWRLASACLPVESQGTLQAINLEQVEKGFEALLDELSDSKADDVGLNGLISLLRSRAYLVLGYLANIQMKYQDSIRYLNSAATSHMSVLLRREFWGCLLRVMLGALNARTGANNRFISVL